MTQLETNTPTKISLIPFSNCTLTITSFIPWIMVGQRPLVLAAGAAKSVCVCGGGGGAQKEIPSQTD